MNFTDLRGSAVTANSGITPCIKTHQSKEAQVREILGKAKTARKLLKGVKYSTDYYQREYKWQEKQIRELVEDLTS